MSLNREFLQEYTKLRQKYKFTDKENNNFIELIQQIGDQEKQLSIYGVSGSVVDINKQVEILKNVIGKLMITFDDESDRIDYILDIVNAYKKEIMQHYH